MEDGRVVCVCACVWHPHSRTRPMLSRIQAGIGVSMSASACPQSNGGHGLRHSRLHAHFRVVYIRVIHAPIRVIHPPGRGRKISPARYRGPGACGPPLRTCEYPRPRALQQARLRMVARIRAIVHCGAGLPHNWPVRRD